jgi:glutamate-1-semialdehyde 2,1-aminomutase
MAAMVATQRGLTPEHFATTGMQGLRLQNGIRDILADVGIPAIVQGFPLVFHVAFGLTAPPHNYRDIARRDHARYVRFAHAMLQRGIRILERGAWFVSSAHDAGVIDETLAVVREAAEVIARE